MIVSITLEEGTMDQLSAALKQCQCAGTPAGRFQQFWAQALASALVAARPREADWMGIPADRADGSDKLISFGPAARKIPLGLFEETQWLHPILVLD
jgi:hypothetical protein